MTCIIVSASPRTTTSSSGSSTTTSSFLSSIFGPSASTARLATSVTSNDELSTFAVSMLCMRERSSMRLTSLESRLVSSAMTAMYFCESSCGIIPSRRPSANPEIVVMGVFSSWETFSTNSRLLYSAGTET